MDWIESLVEKFQNKKKNVPKESTEPKHWSVTSSRIFVEQQANGAKIHKTWVLLHSQNKDVLVKTIDGHWTTAELQGNTPKIVKGKIVDENKEVDDGSQPESIDGGQCDGLSTEIPQQEGS